MRSCGLRLTDDYTTFIRVSYRKEFPPPVLQPVIFLKKRCSPSYEQQHFEIEPEAIYSCKKSTAGFMLCLKCICITQATQDDSSKWCGRIAGWSRQGLRRGDFDDLQTNNWSLKWEIVADCGHHFPLRWWPLFFFSGWQIQVRSIKWEPGHYWKLQLALEDIATEVRKVTLKHLYLNTYM